MFNKTNKIAPAEICVPTAPAHANPNACGARRRRYTVEKKTTKFNKVKNTLVHMEKANTIIQFAQFIAAVVIIL